MYTHTHQSISIVYRCYNTIQAGTQYKQDRHACACIEMHRKLEMIFKAAAIIRAQLALALKKKSFKLLVQSSHI